MLAPLDYIEAKIERLLERDFVKLWQSHIEPHAVAQQIARALEDGASTRPTQRARKAAPSTYEVRLHPIDTTALLKTMPDFSERMVSQLTQIARELNLMLLDPPTVRITPDDQVQRNDLRITTNVSPDHPDATRQITPLHTTNKADDTPALKAYLIVDGHREIALQKPLITLGRDVKNDLVLEQPGISRNHAQLRQRQSSWVLFDLNSSSGTFLNGERISETALQTGDVISLASAQIIFVVEHSDASYHVDPQQLSGRTLPLHHNRSAA